MSSYYFILMKLETEINFKMIWDHSFSTFAKFSEKLTFLTHCYAYQRVRNVRFSEYFGNVVYKRSMFVFAALKLYNTLSSCTSI